MLVKRLLQSSLSEVIMLEIAYSLCDKALPKEKVSGFELGYISLRCSEGNGGCEDLKNQPSMIFLTISDLLLALAEYEEKKLGFQEVIGVDSSLSLCFERVKEFTKIKWNGSHFATMETREVLKEFYCSAMNFCRMYFPFLLTSVRNDLEYAFDRMKKIT